MAPRAVRVFSSALFRRKERTLGKTTTREEVLAKRRITDWQGISSSSRYTPAGLPAKGRSVKESMSRNGISVTNKECSWWSHLPAVRLSCNLGQSPPLESSAPAQDDPVHFAGQRSPGLRMAAIRQSRRTLNGNGTASGSSQCPW